jgi:CheY-like chemotaxis protein
MLGCKQVQGLDTGKPTVLVVDDVMLVRILIADSLRARGFEVVEASSGEEAIRILEAEFSVDVVLSDVYMPGAEVDGLGLARWLRRHRPGVKLLLGSGVNPTLGSADEALSDGPLVLKPYDYEKLEKALRAALA